MQLVFEKVLVDEESKIKEIYQIIKDCGMDMFENENLFHWKIPYPIKFIKKDCIERELFLVKDLDINQYVHTFQLEFNKTILNAVNIKKFATAPQNSGSGIGKYSMQFIENYCRKQGVTKLNLDVYEKSERAIRFYKNRGFKIIGKKLTKYFLVYVMEKKL